MATQDGTGSPSSGFITSGIDKFMGNLQNFQGGGLFGSASMAPAPQSNVWDELLQHFAYQYPTLPDAGPRLPEPETDDRFRLPLERAVEDRQAELERQQREKYLDEFRSVQADRQRLIRLAREAGLDTSNTGAVAGLWAQAVKEAEGAYMVDPRDNEIELVWEVLERWAREGAPGTFKEEETREQQRREWYEEHGEPYSETRVDERVSLTDPDTAEQVVIEALRRRIGKEPDEDMIRSFVGALNARERANPTRTTTVTNYAADGRVLGTESETEGSNVSPASFAMGFEEDELEGEERAYTAGVTYAPVIDQLVGGF